MAHDPHNPAFDNVYRHIPSVNALVDAPALADWYSRIGRDRIVHAARCVLDEHREELAASNGDATPASVDVLGRRVAQRLDRMQRPPLGRAINATGIILHTGLGRAVLADAAADCLLEAATHYAPVELNMTTGQRGRRGDLVRPLLRELTGAESATVVNNNAAALVLTLAAVAAGRSVIVSRGELIEIGGSFRLPEVMSAGGAMLREVGTTNRTRIADFEAAVDEHTAALLRVHTSNYRIEGFTEAPTLAELVSLGRRTELPVIHDIGSGLLRPLPDSPLAGEPDARTSIEAGADLVLFSGDKLLGGPQAGVIIGRRKWIEAIERHPLMRAMRVDKLVLAALGATLHLHADPQQALREIPVLRMLTTPIEALRRRADRLVEALRGKAGGIDIAAAESVAYLGGGSLPAESVPSKAIVIRCAAADVPEELLAMRLRTGAPAVVPRVHGGAVWLDLRTVSPDEDDELADAIVHAVASAHGAR